MFRSRQLVSHMISAIAASASSAQATSRDRRGNVRFWVGVVKSSMTELGARKRPSVRRPREHELQPESGNYFLFRAILTEAQSQGTKVASTVARDGKTEGISRLLN